MIICFACGFGCVGLGRKRNGIFLFIGLGWSSKLFGRLRLDGSMKTDPRTTLSQLSLPHMTSN